MRVLILGCHCDDIELGCGGTIHKHRNDWEINCVTLSNSGVEGALPELLGYSEKAISSLGVGGQHYDFCTNDFWKYRQYIWECLYSLDQHFSPDLVITQAADDHQDHVVLFEETKRNFKRSTVLSYYSSVKNTFSPTWNWFEEITQEDLDKKMVALSFYKCYQTKPYFRPAVVEAQARMMGLMVEKEFAEAYQLVRKVA